MNSVEKKRVAIVPCESYEKKNVIKAVYQLMDLLKANLNPIECNARILLKPNLCLPESPHEAITTHPMVIYAVKEWIEQFSSSIYLGDGPVGEATADRQELIYKMTGVNNVIKESGYTIKKINFYNKLVKQEVIISNKRIKYYLPEIIKDFACIINLPKFKTHSLMTFTGAVKNLYGLLPGESKKIMHSLLPNKYDFAELQLDICNKVNPSINIMDAVYGIEGEGPGKRGKKKYIGCLLASTDPIALDMVCSILLNISNNSIPINAIALKKGYMVDQIEVVGSKIADFIMEDYILPKTVIMYKENDKYIQRIFDLAREKVKIDQSTCKKCKLCISVCPVEALSFDNKVIVKDDICISCKTCVEICPEGAIDIAYSKLYTQIREVGAKSNE